MGSSHLEDGRILIWVLEIVFYTALYCCAFKGD
jgi:hypothetical protein